MKKLVMVLTLALIVPSAMAARTIDCNKVPSHESCKGSSSQGSRTNGKSSWEICINGINLQGGSCSTDSWPTGWGQPKQIQATGRDAIDVIRNSNIVTSGFDNQGWARFVVIYNGNYTPAKGKTFSCKVSPSATQFECLSWAPNAPQNF